MKLQSVFLRNGCDMPAQFDLLREPYGKHWALLKDIGAHTFDTMIRKAGWHFVYGRKSYSGKSIARGQDKGIHRALTHALHGVPAQFNAAELISIEIAKHLGFYFARVGMQPRHIQQYSSLDLAAADQMRSIPAR